MPFVFGLLALVLMNVGGTAQQPTPLSQGHSLTGLWTIQLRHEGKDVGKWVLDLQQNGQNLGGKLFVKTPGKVQVFSVTGEIDPEVGTFALAWVATLPNGRAPGVFAGTSQDEGTFVGASADSDSHAVIWKATRTR